MTGGSRGTLGMAIALGLLLALTTAEIARARPEETPVTASAVVQVGRYRLQSSLWVNLHQRLLYAARFEPATPAALSGGDLSKWNRAVESYRAFLGERSPIFDHELIDLNARLSGTRSAKLPDSIPRAAATALESVMPLYREGQWQEDDRANRFWIAVAEPLLASAEEELVEAHEKVYGMPFPKAILVDVTGFAWEFGAYTVGNPESAHAVIASSVSGTQGFGALESLMHEPSHAIVGAESGAIGADLSRASRELGIRPMANLWHAILFYTSGELTRRALARRGVTDYRPFILDMYDRAFRGYRKPLETHWQAYLDGRISRETAICQVLIETTPGR